MESLKALYDLENMATAVNVPFLKHMYSNFNPAQSKNLANVMKNFHIREFETSDFRSAYQSLVDFLYGWDLGGGAATEENQGDVSSQNAPEAGAAPEAPQGPRRKPRNIRLTDEIEQQECDRLLKTFQTVFAIHRRILTKCTLDIEERLMVLTSPPEAPTVTSPTKEDTTISASVDPLQVRSRAGSRANLSTSKSDMNLDNSRSTTELEATNQEGGFQLAVKPAADGKASSSDVTDVTVSFTFPVAGSSVQTVSMTLGTAETVQNKLNELYNDVDHALDYFIFCLSTLIIIVALSEAMKEKTSYQRYLRNVHAMAAEFISDIFQRIYQLFHLEIQPDGSLMFLLNESGHSEQQTNVSLATPAKPGGLVTSASDVVVIRDISLTDLRNLDSLKDLVQRLLAMKAKAQAYLASNVAISARNVTESAVSGEQRDDPKNVASTQVSLFQQHLTQLRNKSRMAKYHFKFGLIHELFMAFDIHLFPNFVAAHKDGLKSFEASTFDPSFIWLTGGFDSLIRIFDLNTRQCLSQFAGHRSIVTDVHFIPETNDTKFLSSSFDRTLKLWNTQSATVERSFQGHTEAVLTCDVSTDRRLIASGSTDHTIRLWDVNTGDCLATIKRHSRWIKVVRFTKDGRYLLSVGMDKRVIVWDVKVVLNASSIISNSAAKNEDEEEDRRPNHDQDLYPCIRSIDAHRDYILSLALTDHRPAWMLTCSRDMTVKMHDFLSGDCLYEINLEPSWACSVAFGPDGSLFATGSFDNNIIIFKTDNGERLRQIRVFNLGITGVAFPDSYNHIVCGTSEGHLQLIPL